jgi:hypothetical protein
MREPPNRDLQPTAWIGSLLPGFPPLKPRCLRFSRRAAIGCCHGRQPMEWSELIALKPPTGRHESTCLEFLPLMFEMAIRIVVIADWRHACRCFATPTSPLDRSSDWRPRLLHGIASQFSRNRAIFRLGMEVATLRSRDDADTPSTSKLRPPVWRPLAQVPHQLDDARLSVATRRHSKASDANPRSTGGMDFRVATRRHA